MTDTNSTNSAYEEMLREHAKMRNLMDELKQLLFDRSVAISEIASRLVLLQAMVEVHFRTEEDSSCFPDLISHAPRVSDKVAVLIAEHGEMTVDISELVARTSSCQGTEEDWDMVNSGFAEFEEKLMQHETVENELLQEVFTEDIGSKD